MTTQIVGEEDDIGKQRLKILMANSVRRRCVTDRTRIQRRSLTRQVVVDAPGLLLSSLAVWCSLLSGQCLHLARALLKTCAVMSLLVNHGNRVAAAPVVQIEEAMILASMWNRKIGPVALRSRSPI